MWTDKALAVEISSLHAPTHDQSARVLRLDLGPPGTRSFSFLSLSTRFIGMMRPPSLCTRARSSSVVGRIWLDTSAMIPTPCLGSCKASSEPPRFLAQGSVLQLPSRLSSLPWSTRTPGSSLLPLADSRRVSRGPSPPPALRANLPLSPGQHPAFLLRLA